MIQNQLKLISLADIKIPRESRQRTALSPTSVYDLALNIAQHGLLQNIGVNSETHEIIFGERRYTAFTLLHAVCGGPDDTLTHLEPAQCVELRAAAEEHKLYESWSKIPTRIVKAPDHISAQSLEFIENVNRVDLPWQDKAAAAYTIHKAALDACKLRNADREPTAALERWSEGQTASLLGISTSYFNQLITPLRELETATEKSAIQVKDAIEKSATPLAASNAAKAIKERYSEKGAGRPKLAGKPLNPIKSAPSKPESKLEPDPEPEVPILNANFHEWAVSYSGQPFNLIHCDFPYGIGYNTGGNFSSSQATVQQGEYDDSEEVYWDLLTTLAKHSSKLLDKQAHIMFWFSQNLLRETLEFFEDHMPYATVHKHMMIWVHPAKQTTPDPHRYGQRNYETALCLTLGDRKVVRPKRLAVVHDEQSKIHRSQKPLTVLSHFFEMFVDGSTRMLDPTCGSATSLIAASKLGASRVLGLELDKDAHEQGVKHWRENNESRKM